MNANETQTRGIRPVQESDTRPIDADAPRAGRHESPSAVLRRSVIEGVGHALAQHLNNPGRADARWSHALRATARYVATALVGVLGTASYVVATDDLEPSPAAAVVHVPVPQPVQQPDECADTQALVQYIIHVAMAGESLARKLDAQGQPEIAEGVRAMTDVNELPNKIAICTLRAKQQQRQHGE